jgi:protein gp37
MSAHSLIQWTDATWNFLLGCSVKSKGCFNCYAVFTCWRLAHNPNPKIARAYAGLVRRLPSGKLAWTGKINVVPERLLLPLGWRTPRRIFVNSQSDLFHEHVSFDVVDQAFAVMALCPIHTFQILTKRPERMRDYAVELLAGRRHLGAALRALGIDSFIHRLLIAQAYGITPGDRASGTPPYRPFQNVILGTSVEDQTAADHRFPFLCQLGECGWSTMVSLEPLLGPVTVPDRYLALGSRAWPIIGGESGKNARPSNVDHIRSIVAQCHDAEIRVFVKQLGANVWFGAKQYGRGSGCYISHSHGGDPAEWPADLRIREFPSSLVA